MGKRRTVTISYECGGPPELFGPEDDIPQELWDLIPNGLNCDGGGVPGSWCIGCRWRIPEVEEDEEVE